MSRRYKDDEEEDILVTAEEAAGYVSALQEAPPASMRALVDYSQIGMDGKPIPSGSLHKKHEFVLAFFNLGNIGRAYQEIFDASLDIKKATLLGENLAKEDQFVSDLLTIARKNIEENCSSILAEHTSILGLLRDGAAANGKWAPAIAAEMARGKALGVYDAVKASEPEALRSPESLTEDMVNKVIEYLCTLAISDKKAICSLIMGGRS